MKTEGQMATTIEVLLKRVQIGQNGEDEIAAAATLLSASLAYPNEITPTRTSVKALKLKDNADIDFSAGTDPATNAPYTYADRVVFKETIRGKTALTVALATVHKTPKLEKFLAGVFGAVFGAAWKLVVGGITNVLAGAAVEAVGAAHVKSLESEDEQSNPIGEAFLEFDDNSIPTSPIVLQLRAPADLTIEKFVLVSGKPQRVKVQLLTKGQNNGVVELEVRTI
jgi:hypothetical protein